MLALYSMLYLRVMRKPIDQALRDEIQASGISAKKLAAQTGIAQTTISRFIRGGTMSIANCEKIAEILGLELRKKR